ncbi:MAG: TVP38/TMEM64 family protein [Verrucomicrobia bacterium]|nr:TVP38/TMEM64 family protein [Verrucomicrobiota bacterium]
MSASKKIILLFFLLCTLILVNFLIFGENYEQLFSMERSGDFLREYGTLAGLVGAGLLVVDLVLPIPSSGVIGGLGAALGVGAGFFWGWFGLVLSAFTGYGIARLGGRKWADRLAAPEEQRRFQHMFDTWGGLALVSSRMLPILPEVLSVLAGLYRMHFSRFVVATLLGAIPPAFVYAWLGARAREHPGPALWALVGITVVAWFGFLAVKKRYGGEEPDADL